MTEVTQGYPTSSRRVCRLRLSGAQGQILLLPPIEWSLLPHCFRMRWSGWNIRLPGQWLQDWVSEVISDGVSGTLATL